MHILDHIIQQKKKEIKIKKELIPLESFMKTEFYKAESKSLKRSIQNANNIPVIAEFKRRSPSREVINQKIHVIDVAESYQKLSFCAMSILTDQHFFGGSLEDLVLARSKFKNPILRKEFIIDAYQIHETKAYGADVILLIASILSTNKLKSLYQTATDLGLEVLVEIHNQQELEKALEVDAEIIGINNRNLKTFEVDLKNSVKLANQIPHNKIKISESGISNPETIKMLQSEGFDAFLIGENFMKSTPDSFDKNCSSFIQNIK
ncbi:indole-3-glycerol phosphate synthase TrpC [Psychroflexus halocasei]|uniref:Indole-3-glycerol phosphate synthase n=1 Tax=Psychroflexus halocasei TaxID=908615 RepID=A0A1H3WJZ2_9FLAO|nr:indole-3-glycerol phosphate synthase TrpC [Psychroflexus halocasei]SDZ87439.1 indole-3-glycerol phosphate synthase [Psychroflexus halocasei]